MRTSTWRQRRAHAARWSASSRSNPAAAASSSAAAASTGREPSSAARTATRSTVVVGPVRRVRWRAAATHPGRPASPVRARRCAPRPDTVIGRAVPRFAQGGAGAQPVRAGLRAQRDHPRSPDADEPRRAQGSTLVARLGAHQHARCAGRGSARPRSLGSVIVQPGPVRAGQQVLGRAVPGVEARSGDQPGRARRRPPPGRPGWRGRRRRRSAASRRCVPASGRRRIGTIVQAGSTSTSGTRRARRRASWVSQERESAAASPTRTRCARGGSGPDRRSRPWRAPRPGRDRCRGRPPARARSAASAARPSATNEGNGSVPRAEHRSPRRGRSARSSRRVGGRARGAIGQARHRLDQHERRDGAFPGSERTAADPLRQAAPSTWRHSHRVRTRRYSRR